MYVPHKKGTYPYFRQRPMSDIAYQYAAVPGKTY